MGLVRSGCLPPPPRNPKCILRFDYVHVARAQGDTVRCAQQPSSPTCLALGGQVVPICHLMIPFRDFESTLRDVGSRLQTRGVLFAPAACPHHAAASSKKSCLYAPPCISHALVQATVGVGTVLICLI